MRYKLVAFARGKEEWAGMGGLAALGAGQGALGAAEAGRAGRCIRERKCAGQDARGAAGVTRVQRERDSRWAPIKTPERASSACGAHPDVRCGVAFDPHQDVSGVRMSSVVREASAKSLSSGVSWSVVVGVPSRRRH